MLFALLVKSRADQKPLTRKMPMPRWDLLIVTLGSSLFRSNQGTWKVDPIIDTIIGTILKNLDSRYPLIARRIRTILTKTCTFHRMYLFLASKQVASREIYLIFAGLDYINFFDFNVETIAKICLLNLIIIWC